MRACRCRSSRSQWTAGWRAVCVGRWRRRCPVCGHCLAGPPQGRATQLSQAGKSLDGPALRPHPGKGLPTQALSSALLSAWHGRVTVSTRTRWPAQRGREDVSLAAPTSPPVAHGHELADTPQESQGFGTRALVFTVSVSETEVGGSFLTHRAAAPALIEY